MDSAPNQIRFGVFEVRRDFRELRKHGVRLKLEEQPFSVLLVLIDKAGAVVSRDELRGRIWPEDTFVDFDKSLNKAVNKIRAALGDSATTPRYVETLARRGYRFIAPVVADDPPKNKPQPAGRTERHRWVLWSAVGIAVVMLLAGAADFAGVWQAHIRAAPPIQSLAVLPITNLTGTAGQEYFADGLTDDLISDLSRISSLRVISCTSAMHYKSTRKSLPQISRELAVDAVVEGSVQRAEGHTRINVKLLRGAADRQLWSESYEGGTADTAQLEDRVVLAVAHQVSAHLTSEAEARLTSGGSANQHAYEAYLHGRYLWNLRGRDAVIQAGEYFEQAVREDAKFALAWSGLADRYTIGWEAGNPALAEPYARRALALAPDLAEAHISLGFAQTCMRRFAEGEKELKLGIKLNPGYVHGHQLYAVHLLTTGRAQQALLESDRALQLDPFSFPVNNFRSLILVGLRQYARAEQSARAAAELDPGNPDPERQLERIYWLQDRVLEAVEAARSAASLEPEPAAGMLLRGQREVLAAFAKQGFRAACLRSVQLKEQAAGDSWQIPLQYALLRDRQKVLEWAGREISKTGYAGIYQLETSPEYDFLRGDPQFQDVLQRLGLAP